MILYYLRQFYYLKIIYILNFTKDMFFKNLGEIYKAWKES